MAHPFSDLTKELLQELARLPEGTWEMIEDIGRSFSAARGQMVRAMTGRRRPWRTYLRGTVRRLARRGYLQIEHNRVVLTPEGRALTRSFILDTLRIAKTSQWDGHWRIVIWDIPEKRREMRDVLRDKLASLDFVRIQGSVWVLPWPCREEIEYLRQTYSLGRDLLFIEARSIDGEARLRRHFHLSTLE